MYSLRDKSRAYLCIRYREYKMFNQNEQSYVYSGTFLQKENFESVRLSRRIACQLTIRRIVFRGDENRLIDATLRGRNPHQTPFNHQTIGINPVSH